MPNTASGERFIPWLGKHAIAAFVYGLIILMLLIGATQLLGNTQATSLKYLKAIACELGIPVVNGARPPELLVQCWRDEGLRPPTYFTEGT